MAARVGDLGCRNWSRMLSYRLLRPLNSASAHRTSSIQSRLDSFMGEGLAFGGLEELDRETLARILELGYIYNVIFLFNYFNLY